MTTKQLTLDDLFKPYDEAEAQKAAERIVAQRMKLLTTNEKSGFFAFVAMGLLLKEEMPCKTAATDGIYLYFNPNYIATLDNEELQTVICHEALHPALGHPWRRGDRDHKRYNKAADYVINLLLKDDGFKLPPYCLCNEKYRGMSAEEVYVLLKKEPKAKAKGGSTGGGKSGGDTGESGGGGDDDEEDENEGGGKDGDKTTERKMGKGQSLDGEGCFDNHDYWDKATESERAQSGTDEQGWKERTSRAVLIAKMQGKLPSNIASMVEEMIEPKLPWRELLRNFVQDTQKSDYRLMPPSKKYLWYPLYMPSMKGEFLEIGFARDTSGSMGDDEIEAVTSEMMGVADQYENFKLHVWDCDAKAQSYAVVETFDEMREATKTARGRGGTDFRPVFEDIDKRGLNISCLVYLTDGMGTFPKEPPPYPVIWVINQPNIKIPFGEYIFLDTTK